MNENTKNIASDVEEKLKKLKIRGMKNISLVSFPSSKTINTLFYVDDTILKVKTIVNFDGSLEIFIEK